MVPLSVRLEEPENMEILDSLPRPCKDRVKLRTKLYLVHLITRSWRKQEGRKRTLNPRVPVAFTQSLNSINTPLCRFIELNSSNGITNVIKRLTQSCLDGKQAICCRLLTKFSPITDQKNMRQQCNQNFCEMTSNAIPRGDQ